MTIKDLRRSDEKKLRIIAFAFSGIVWLLVAGILIYVFSPHVPFVEPCVWDYEHNGETVYDYSPYLEAIEDDYEEYCLPASEVPPTVKQKALVDLSMEQVKLRRGAARVGIAYFLIITGAISILKAVSMAYIRLNGLRLGSQQYPDFFQAYEAAGKKLGITQLPAAYIIDANGAANAFAVKVVRRKMIVFYAELVERLVTAGQYNQLEAIAAHELTHVLLRHTHYGLLLLPLRFIPIFLSWLSRKQELSADRGAFFVCPDSQAVSQALVKLALGRYVASFANIDQYIQDSTAERGLAAGIARIIATHPPMPQRISELQKLVTANPVIA